MIFGREKSKSIDGRIIVVYYLREQDASGQWFEVNWQSLDGFKNPKHFIREAKTQLREKIKQRNAELSRNIE